MTAPDLSIYAKYLDLWRTPAKLKIRQKKGPRAAFLLRPQQVALLKLLETGLDTLLLKPRQIGASTLVAYYLFWRWYTSEDDITIVILSYKQKSSKHLLKMVMQFYKSLPKELQRPLETNNTDTVILGDSGAELLAVGAKDDGGTRSFTAHIIWLSEFAFMPHAEELLSSTEGSITDDGQVIAESTANHWNDALHLEIQKVQRGEADWQLAFFPWNEHPEYVSDGHIGTYSQEEKALRESHGLTAAQVLWMRKKIRRMGEEKAKREFPLTIKDAYTQAAGSFFSEADLEHLATVAVATKGTSYLEPHVMDCMYTAGMDPGGGVGLDNTVVYVQNVTTGMPAATYKQNRHTFDEALETTAAVTIAYKAWTCIEYNNHGHGYFEAIHSLGACPGFLLHTDEGGKPFFTDKRTKRLLWTHLKKCIQQGDVVGVTSTCLSDLKQIQVDELGRIILPRTSSGHCDEAQALALAMWAAKGRSIRRRSMVDKLISQTRAAAIRARSGAALTMAGTK